MAELGSCFESVTTPGRNARRSPISSSRRRSLDSNGSLLGWRLTYAAVVRLVKERRSFASFRT